MPESKTTLIKYYLPEIDCPACLGTGKKYDTECLGCGGSGHIEDYKPITSEPSEGFKAAVTRAKRRRKFKPVHARGVRD